MPIPENVQILKWPCFYRYLSFNDETLGVISQTSGSFGVLGIRISLSAFKWALLNDS